MSTIFTYANVVFDLQEPWKPITTLPLVGKVNLLGIDGSIETVTITPDITEISAVAWSPLVPPVLKRWRASQNGEFFYVSDHLVVRSWTESFTAMCNAFWQCGNYFQTRAEAEEVLKRVLEVFRSNSRYVWESGGNASRQLVIP